MKKLYFIFSIILLTITAQAQQNVTLKINHLLGSSPFAMSQTTSNNLSNQFNVTRLEYYISEIKLVHDGGQITSVPNTWILVDAAQVSSTPLGSFNITTLESVTFAVGVEAPINNADPNLQPTNHPLAPKSPSMHWGWAAGYRFVAIEGNTGTNMSQIWQIHALGNRNYRAQSVVTSGRTVNSVLEVELDADYTQALSGITVNGNLLTHGEFNEAASLLTNFRTGVFTQSTVGLNEKKNKVSFTISPNPSNGEVKLSIDRSMQNVNYKVLDVNGRMVVNGNLTNTSIDLSAVEKGLYFILLFEKNEMIGSEKVTIQ
jgi:hypothetical protein